MSGAKTRALSVSLALAGALLPAAASAQLDADQDGVVDHVDVFPCDPSRASVVYLPAQDTHGVLMFEDQWPSQGDLDFNDVVLGYNYAVDLDARGHVRFLRGTFSVLAIGGDFDNGLGLQLPVPASAVGAGIKIFADSSSVAYAPMPGDQRATFRLSDNLREFFGGQAGPINSDPRGTQREAVIFEFLVEFPTPTAMDLSEAPFDLFLLRSDAPSHEIHAPEYSGTVLMDGALFNTADDGSDTLRKFVDVDGLPFVLEVPSDVAWPAEGQAISSLWPDIVDFASSAGASHADFYARAVQASFAYAPAARPSPTFRTPNAVPEDVAECLPEYAQGLFQYGTAMHDLPARSAQLSDGDVLLVGYTYGAFPGSTAGGSTDLAILRYDVGTGTAAWARSFGGAGLESVQTIGVAPNDEIIALVHSSEGFSVDGIAVPRAYSFLRITAAGTVVAAYPGEYAHSIEPQTDGPFYVWNALTRTYYDAQGQRGASSTLPSAGNSSANVTRAANGDIVAHARYYVNTTSCRSYSCGWGRTCRSCTGGVTNNYYMERYDPTGATLRWRTQVTPSWVYFAEGTDGTIWASGGGDLFGYGDDGAETALSNGGVNPGPIAVDAASGDVVMASRQRAPGSTDWGTQLTRFDGTGIVYSTFTTRPQRHLYAHGCFLTPATAVVTGHAFNVVRADHDFYVGAHDLATGLMP